MRVHEKLIESMDQRSLQSLRITGFQVLERLELESSVKTDLILIRAISVAVLYEAS